MGGEGGVGWGGQGGCEQRIEVFVKIQKKNWGGGGGRSGGEGSGWGGGQGGCKRRIEVFVKIQKKKYFFFFWGGVVGGGVRVDVNEELKFLGKFKKRNWGGAGWGRVGGVWKDVNEELKFL